ncbi:hypothetical protein [Amycolatopsis sp. lyj-346]|uniref:hypothetical protein n=1 Tax=Amycolatopsis sp. lyj-346 TaxID=2789289 RepID=UPI00397C8161
MGNWGKRVGALATVAIALTALGVPAAEAGTHRPAWQPTLLPLPAGADPAGRGYLTSTNGHGEYTGSFVVDGKLQVVSWRGGKPVLRGVPAGYESAMAADENRVGTVVGTATDNDTGEIRPFVLDARGFRFRVTPAGYQSARGVDINSRGDVLGQVTHADPAKNGSIVWPANGSAPVIIPKSHEIEFPMDIDDDGTILFIGSESVLLWKNGRYLQRTAPGFRYAEGSALRDGVVVGSVSDGTIAGTRAGRWDAAGRFTLLPGGIGAYALNRFGLIAGATPAPDAIQGPPMAWWGTTAVGALKQPGAYKQYQASQVSDDGTILGVASDRPVYEGGVPVMWRFRG